MKERPILFSSSMVRTILEGRKSQTRRVVKGVAGASPYGVPGDRLWVRETWTSGYQNGCFGTIYRADNTFIQGKRQHEKGPHFHAKEIGGHVRWRPSIFLPRWASRITLEITDVRVQRVQEISEEDAGAEGVIINPPHISIGWDGSPIESSTIDWAPSDYFAHLWDSINAKRGFGWDLNPWVWCLTFKVLDGVQQGRV